LFKDHKPSSIQGEDRLRGLYRNISAKSIISVYPPPEASASRDTSDTDDSQCIGETLAWYAWALLPGI